MTKQWRRSSRCDSGRCVDVAVEGDGVYVRDATGAELCYDAAAFADLLAWLRRPLVVNGPSGLDAFADLSKVERPKWTRQLHAKGYTVDGTVESGSWFEITNANTSSADVYIYDEIGFWGTTAADFVTELRALSVASINLHINSPGGEVFDGIAIYNALKQHSATVTTYIDGLAASAASFVAMAGEHIVIARNAQMMIHDAIGVVIGNAAEMQRMADLLGRLSNSIADIYAQRAGGSVEDWRSLMLAETWFDATEAVGYGLADEMTGADEPADDSANADAAASDAWDLSIFAHAGRQNAPAPAPINRTANAKTHESAGDVAADDWFALAEGLFSPQADDDPLAGLWR